MFVSKLLRHVIFHFSTVTSNQISFTFDLLLYNSVGIIFSLITLLRALSRYFIEKLRKRTHVPCCKLFIPPELNRPKEALIAKQFSFKFVNGALKETNFVPFTFKGNEELSINCDSCCPFPRRFGLIADFYQDLFTWVAGGIFFLETTDAKFYSLKTSLFVL